MIPDGAGGAGGGARAHYHSPMRFLASALLLLAAAPLPAQAPVRALSFNIRYGTAAMATTPGRIGAGTWSP